MIFANPNVLYFLALLPLLVVIFVLAERKRRRQLALLIDGSKPGLVMGAGFERRLLHLIFLCLGMGLLVCAAARPRWGTKLETLHAKGFDILVAVDTSESMRAADVSPDRISKARQEVDKFLSLLEGDRVGLIAFAGSAYSYCPLTVDYSAIRLFLNGLEPGVIADSGTNISAAIEEALKVFTRDKSTAHKVLVLFSDGEHHEEDPMPFVARAAEMGVQIFTVGIGNVAKAGERVPQVDEATGEVTYKLDRQGNLVISKLDEATLRAIAEKGNGTYYRVTDAGTELIKIYQSLAGEQEVEFSARRQRLMEERYQIPLVAAFVLLVLAYSLGDRSFQKLRRTQGVPS